MSSGLTGITWKIITILITSLASFMAFCTAGFRNFCSELLAQGVIKRTGHKKAGRIFIMTPCLAGPSHRPLSMPKADLAAPLPDVRRLLLVGPLELLEARAPVLLAGRSLG